MTGEKGGLLAGLRAEALKSRHAAPVRLAVLMALPMPLLGAMPYRGVQIFSAWNYWYALFLPVSLSLVVACVARADARTRMRGLLGLGFPLGRAWSLMPLPQLFPPSASMVIPTSFIPVLPSGEPLAADMALGGALAADGMLTLAGLAVCAIAFAALTAAGAAWFKTLVCWPRSGQL